MMSGNILGRDEVSTVIVLSLVTVAYALVCLYTSQQVQLNVAKILTLIFAVVMCSVTIGVAEQVCVILHIVFTRLTLGQPRYLL